MDVPQDNLTQQRRDTRLLWPRLHVDRVFARLCAFIAVLLACYVVTTAMRMQAGSGQLQGLTRLFDLDAQASVPTFFSVLQLNIAAGLLWIIGSHARRRSDRYDQHWLVLAAIFIFLGLDKVAQIHELIEAPLRAAMHLSGVPQVAWLVPYGVLVALIGWTYLGFLAQLPTRTRMLLILSGALYTGGAAGLEMYGGNLAMRLGGPAAAQHNLAYLTEVFFEQAAEMFGIALFIYTLLGHIQATLGRVQINLGPVPDDPPEKQDLNATETLQIPQFGRSNRP